MINHCFYYFRTLYHNAAKKQGGQLAIKAEDKSPTKPSAED
jgi:hypothetical protein